jgi:serine/threonine-protein kinase
MRTPHPLRGDVATPLPLEDYLGRVGSVFVALRGHDSHNISFGVDVDGDRYFVKYTEHEGALRYLHGAVTFHAAVQHPAIVPLVGTITPAAGFAVVHPWRDADVLNDAFAPNPEGALPRDDPRSTFARFRALPIDDLLRALDSIFDAHRAVAQRGFVAVDFYDGSILYDFARNEVYLCDLDTYCPGPYVLDVDVQFGSSRFMAPEESQRGAKIDERTTVFTLGRTAFVFLSRGLLGEQDEESWRTSAALYAVARRAVRRDPANRHASVAEFVTAWQAAR